MNRISRRFAGAVSLAAILLLTACESTNDGNDSLPVVLAQVQEAFPNLEFRRPVDMQIAPDGSNLLYVVQQAGTIVSFENRDDVSTSHIFMNITDRVSRQDNEEGLLGLAFHPDYAQNGEVYVYYSAPNPRRSVVSRFKAVNGTVDPGSEEVLLEVTQPFGNHNAGQMHFGPDGYLYIALGDGGSGGDPMENGQNLRTHLGKLLRIDVDGTSGERSYAIPSDNPFAGNSEGYREEIFAYGLRNPWRFSFDRDTGVLWLGDVGQERFEEVNIIERGGNYGWDTAEASWCFEPMQDCNEDGLTRPIFSYAHNEGRSITGGYVYHGSTIPNLAGRYVYGDYVSGKIWALHYDGSAATNQLLVDTDIPITSFGQDRAGEVFVLSLDGEIYRLAPRAQ
ncbi:MAG TPA: PQQ-dependent sugar dehydrogenase [Rhodothermales bacterium]